MKMYLTGALAILMMFSSLCPGASPAGPGPAPANFSIALNSPLNGSVVGGYVNITGVVIGPDAPNATVSVSIDEGPYYTAAGSTNWRFLWGTAQFTDGTHTIRARAQSSGAEDNILAVVTVDNTPSETIRIAGAVPAQGNVSVRVGMVVAFNVSVGGNSSLPQSVAWVLDGAINLTGARAFEFSFDTVNRTGNHTVEATLLAGGRTADTRLWNITVRPPAQEPAFRSADPRPDNYTAGLGETVNFRVNFSDPEGAVLSYNWTVRGSLAGNATSPGHAVKFDRAGKWTIVACASNGEQSASVSWNVTVEESVAVGAGEFAPCIAYLVVGAVTAAIYGRRVRRSGYDPAHQ